MQPETRHDAVSTSSPDPARGRRWRSSRLGRVGRHRRAAGMLGSLLCFAGLVGCSSSSGDAGTPGTGGAAPSSATGGATGTVSGASGGATEVTASGGAGTGTPGTGGAAVLGGSGGQRATSGTGGNRPPATATGGSGVGGRAPASGTGGITGGGAAGVGAAGGSVVVTPPVSDPTSTLGISAAGGGNHVEGNLPYGPLTMQRLDVIYPNGAGPKGTMTLPGVIMFHGGGWTDNKPAALKASMSSFYSRYLAHGYLVCNVEYRLADGTANGAIAPAAVQDALLAAKWFWDHMDYYHVDKTQYVVTGASAGGHLALMVGMATADSGLGPTNPTDFKIAAVVNGYGPSDVADLISRGVGFAVQWLPASTPNRAAIEKQVSPVTYVRPDIPPLITVQGMNDTTVPTAESQHLFDLLTAAGADTALHFVPGAGHGFSTPAGAWADAEPAMFNFLTQHHIGK